MSREREGTERYTETVTLDAVLDVFETVAGPVVTSADVADALKCSRATARRKLGTLEQQGIIASRKTAGRLVWWQVNLETEPADVDPDDPFWDLDPSASGGTAVSENADDRLYDA